MLKMTARFFLVKAKILGLSVLLASACHGPKEDSRDSTKAPSIISESFVVKPFDADGNNADPNVLSLNRAGRIGIKKNSLEREFLLQGAIIPQTMIPQFSGLKSRIVAFKSVGDKLYMMEATQGHQISPTLPQNLVLAEFPVVFETDTEIFFDFAKGMNKIYVKDDWTGQDFAGSDYSMDHWTSLDLGISYIEDASIDEKNNLVITQVAQTREPFLGVRNQAVPVSIKYYLSPYAPNPKFKSFVQESFDRMGFFEISPQLKQQRGDTVIYAAKFNLPEPGKFITYAISSNTPTEYKQAVEDGVLYWNQAFGREVLKVEYLNEPLTAPNFSHNIIQWVEWDNAGSAYADAQMDPRTGEILHAQIFMTSAFAFGGRAKARKLLQRIKSESHDHHHHDHDSSKHQLLGLLGMGKTPLCFYHPGEQLTTSLENLLSRNDVDEAGFLKISQDYVREVVAHEVGHTLGLRHNFAGSLGSNLSPAMSQVAYDDYLKNSRTPSYVTTSSSVMEYQIFEDSTMSGDIIARREHALDYDIKAIQTLYDKKSYANSEVPLFCTDTHTEEFVDCNRFDSGSSVFEFYYQQERKARARLHYTIMENYIAGKSLESRDVNELELSLSAFSPSPSSYAAQVFSNRSLLFKFLKEGNKVLKVRRSYDYINDLIEGDVASEEQDFFESEIKSHSVAEIFEEISSSEILEGKKKFDTLMQDESYLSGIGPEGEPYRFDQDDLAIMKADTEKFFSRLEVYYSDASLTAFKSLNGWRSLSVGRDVATLISRRAQKIVETARIEPGQTLPDFIYPHSMRLKAANLHALKSSDPVWLKQDSIGDVLRFGAIMKSVMGGPIDKVDVRSLSEEKMRWFLENLEVYSVLQKAL